MSRVYNALTGTSRPAAPSNEKADEQTWEPGADAPFIEIGAPTGPLFSSAALAASAAVQISAKAAAAKLADLPKLKAVPESAPELKPEAKPEPKPEAARAFPRLVPTAPVPATAYLSVKFHDLSVRPARLATDGPDASLVTFHFPEHAVSVEYRVLRDEIRQQLPDSAPRVLLFAAAASEAGTTTVMLNTAVTFALEGKGRVLVVDANLNRPAIAAKLALKAAPGLCEVLANRVPLAWAVQPSVVPALQVLPAGVADANTPAEVGRDLPKLLGQLREWYDLVLVDAGVWGTMPERDAASPAADAVYLVTRDGDADRPEFLNLRGSVKETGGLLRGYVATRA